MSHWAAGATVMMHFFELGVLVRGKHSLVSIVALSQKGLHLISFLLGQQVVILVNGLDLAVKIFPGLP